MSKNYLISCASSFSTYIDAYVWILTLNRQTIPCNWQIDKPWQHLPPYWNHVSVLSAPTPKLGQPEQSRYPVLGRSITVLRIRSTRNNKWSSPSRERENKNTNTTVITCASDTCKHCMYQEWGFFWTTSPHLTSPHLTSLHLTSPHITSPNLTSPHLTSPHFTSLHLTSPHLGRELSRADLTNFLWRVFSPLSLRKSSTVSMLVSFSNWRPKWSKCGSHSTTLDAS